MEYRADHRRYARTARPRRRRRNRPRTHGGYRLRRPHGVRTCGGSGVTHGGCVRRHGDAHEHQRRDDRRDDEVCRACCARLWCNDGGDGGAHGHHGECGRQGVAGRYRPASGIRATCGSAEEGEQGNAGARHIAVGRIRAASRGIGGTSLAWHQHGQHRRGRLAQNGRRITGTAYENAGADQ